MANTIDQNIEINCPNLFSDANKSRWVTNAQLSIDADCYGDKYTLAVALRACHDYTLAAIQKGIGSGSSGAISSKREGDQAVSFASNASQTGDAYLNMTSFGRELLSIQKGTISRISNTGNDADVTICCTG